MKTTSYEISKQLKEAGFEADADYWFINRKSQKVFLINIKELSSIELMNEIGVSIESYELETILDALPLVIKREGWGNDIYFKMNKNALCYENSCSFDLSESPLETYYHINKQKNESLADTAGKMWLLLKEKGLI